MAQFTPKPGVPDNHAAGRCHKSPARRLIPAATSLHTHAQILPERYVAMRLIAPLFALTLGLAAATPANAGAGRWGQDLRFVADTTIPGGDPIALCHLVDFMDVLFIPVYTITEGYALSSDRCSGTAYRDLSPEHMADLQAAGMIPSELPVKASVSWKQAIIGHTWLVLAAAGLLAKGLGRIGSVRRKRPARTPDTLAIHSLVAMSQVAIADGRIDDAEVRQIATILTRLTGNGYSPQKVMEMLSRLNPSPNDLAQIGQELSERDRQIVLEAALNIAVADGEIHPSEYAVVSDLAQRMRIGADQFRGALTRISAHLQTVQPA